jgi:hypothetical protein
VRGELEVVLFKNWRLVMFWVANGYLLFQAVEERIRKSVKSGRIALKLKMYMLEGGRGLNKGLAKASIVLIVLSVLALLAAVLPIADAALVDFHLNPTQGVAGTSVHVTASGFKGQVTISFGNKVVVKTFSSGMPEQVSTVFSVPSVSAGTYLMQIVDENSNYASASFTILSTEPVFTPTPSDSSQTPKVSATPKASSTPKTSATPKPTSAAGFWSPPVIIGAIVVAAVAIIVPMFFIFRRRGSRDLRREDEVPIYKPEPFVLPKKPTETNRYAYGSKPSSYAKPSYYSSQLSRPIATASTTRSSPPHSYAKPQLYTKTCPRCKRMVRDDYNLCPYCDKKLK